jgi:hypothetical protein
MSYGIRIINNANITLIDQDYASYALHSSGTASYGIAIPNVSGALVFVRNINEANAKSTIVSGGFPGTTMVLDGPPVDYLILIPASALAPGTGYGANIFKGNGQLAFSTAYSYLTLSAIPSIDALVAGEVTVTLGASSKLRYFCLNPCCAVGYASLDDIYYEPPVHAYEGSLYFCGVMINNNEFRFGDSGYAELYAQLGGRYSGSIYGAVGTKSILILER